MQVNLKKNKTKQKTKIKSGKQHYSILSFKSLQVSFAHLPLPLPLYPHMVCAVSHSLKDKQVVRQASQTTFVLLKKKLFQRITCCQTELKWESSIGQQSQPK